VEPSDELKVTSNSASAPVGESGPVVDSVEISLSNVVNPSSQPQRSIDFSPSNAGTASHGIDSSQLFVESVVAASAAVVPSPNLPETANLALTVALAPSSIATGSSALIASGQYLATYPPELSQALYNSIRIPASGTHPETATRGHPGPATASKRFQDSAHFAPSNRVPVTPTFTATNTDTPAAKTLRSSTSSTGTILGIVIAVILIIVLAVTMWLLFGRRKLESSNTGPAEECEAAVESQEAFSLEETFDSCDGGTNLDDQDMFDQGFETQVFGNAMDEEQPGF
jgi:hypothetical protein